MLQRSQPSAARSAYAHLVIIMTSQCGLHVVYGWFHSDLREQARLLHPCMIVGIRVIGMRMLVERQPCEHVPPLC